MLRGADADYPLIEEEELASPGQKRCAAEVRGVAAWAGQGGGSATLSDLAKRFGRDISFMKGVVRRLKNRSRNC